MMIRSWVTAFLSGTILVTPPAYGLQAQSRSQKPVLIRDTDKAEGKDDTESGKEKEYDPALAEHNVRVGDFYLKKKNYDAAARRYEDAIEYQPSLLQAYEALARAHEKNGDRIKAAGAYREFIRRNPDSPKIPEINERIARLEKRGR